MNSITPFCNVTELSRLISKEELSELLGSFRSQNKEFQNEHEELLGFVDFLVEAGKLTRWQTEMLLAGKHRGFILGNFVLLDRMPGYPPSAVFDARELGSNAIVSLEIDRSSRTSGEKDITFRVTY